MKLEMAYSMETPPVDMTILCHKEIVELHQFFQDWFLGKLADTEDEFGRLATVLTEEFVIVDPGGRPFSRQALLHSIRHQHGKWSEQHTARLQIKNYQFQWQVGPICLATYEEWQQVEEAITARLISGYLRYEPTAMNQVVWLHVHEVWLDTPYGIRML